MIKNQESFEMIKNQESFAQHPSEMQCICVIDLPMRIAKVKQELASEV